MPTSKKAPKKEQKPLSSTKPPKEKAAKRWLSVAETGALLALDPAFDAPIDRPVADIQQEARDLEAVLAKVGKEIYAGSNLDKAVGRSIKERRRILDQAESAWTAHRSASLSKNIRDVRTDAEALKRDAIAALRHFLEEDAATQARVERITIGTGVADLIDDLEKLAPLLDEHASALKKADLPEHAAARARAIAEELSLAVADRAVDPEAAVTMSLRNRAYWSLREAMDAVRSAGRYVYRKRPKLLVAFRASSTRARARAGTVRSTPEATSAAGNGAPTVA